MWTTLRNTALFTAVAIQPLTGAVPVENGLVRRAYQPKTVDVKMSGRFRYSLLQEVDNPDNTESSFKRTIDTSYEIVRSNFLEETSSQTKTESESVSSGIELGASYGVAEAKVSAGMETSSQLETAFSSVKQISTQETISEKKSTEQSFTVGKGDSYKIYERIFDGPGITIHTDAVTGGSEPKEDTEVEFTVTLKQNRFLSDIKVETGDSEFSEPNDAIRMVDNGKADVNKGYGGDYVWLVPVWTTQVEDAASNVQVVIQESEEEGHDDLASGAGGDYRYLLPQPQENNSNKITDVQLYRSEDSLSSDALGDMGFQGMSSDINKDRDGDYLYLLWKTIDVDATTVRV
ncbi:hypothetical protein P170DRAFT_392296 [Aspergillus steynii IBT 23096]|uniref:Uncharacterized protein n=1 Tax=Aspergillus steynii IBT 23096 TaxID=1392250 RepID=A0A2I2FUA2_9EURO|nr:uncharacterized protein P170DRAFT_392296 [Aspergillus steynii IBT 23096]PLB44202.1 hypothetical protein P170DRAFT_392296 [Aspergillus steynii IBT 23096]